jgi:hypothetical protein
LLQAEFGREDKRGKRKKRDEWGLGRDCDIKLRGNLDTPPSMRI